MSNNIMTAPLAVIILAAGKGTRMKSELPKVMHKLAGRPMIAHLLGAVAALKPDRVIVVTAPGMDDVAAAVAPAHIAIQDPPRGTGDAVRCALPALGDFKGDVLILLGDMPLISTATLRALIAAKKAGGLSTLGVEFANPPAFGRLVADGRGGIARVVEDRDCTPEEKRITLCALGAYCVDGAKLPGWVAKIGNANAQGEYYFPDIVSIANADGAAVHAHVTASPAEAQGVNDRADLAALEQVVQKSLRVKAMQGGATLLDPDSVFLSWDTALGRDVVVEPNVFFGPGVTVADGVHIKAFCHLEGAAIAAGAIVGPFARLRPGTVIEGNAHIGNFVEIKNARLGAGAKANHHAYIGDADIGARVNFSCGAITVNYDGVDKHRTIVGDGAMVGSNVSLVAPVQVGEGAYLAAGSTITKDVPDGALAVSRGVQKNIEGWAARKKK